MKESETYDTGPSLSYSKKALSALLSVTGFGVYVYLLGLVAVWALIWFAGDRWWFATVLMYGPRWIYALPLIVFIPIALLCKRRLLLILAIASVIIVLPIMGLNLPWQGWTDHKQQAAFRIMTYNIHRWGVSPQEFSELLDEVRPDLVAIQECAPSRWKVPPEWYTKRGVYSLVVSRYPISRVEMKRRKHEVNGLYCVVDAPAGPIGFCCVDLLTPRRALDKVLDSETVFDLSQRTAAQKRIDFRWRESEELSKWLNQFPESKIIAGDFNLTTDSPIYRKFWSAYDNAFSRSEFGFGHTKKTKINIFRYTSRIDHILSTTDFLPLRCWIGPDFGSDHLPVIAEFALD